MIKIEKNNLQDRAEKTRSKKQPSTKKKFEIE